MKLLARAVVGLSLVGTVGLVPGDVAAQTPANEAAEICREADEAGGLEPLGITRGECVNFVKGSSSENANNFIAALCGFDAVQAQVEAKNKGQCIKAVRELFGP